MDVVYRLGEVSVADVLDHFPETTSYDSVRIILGILEKKGYVTHKRKGQRYIYLPTKEPGNAGQSALEHLLSTFFEGSAKKVVSTLVNLPDKNLSPKELDELVKILEEAKKEKEK